MSELPPSVIAHVSLGTDNYERAIAFYDKVLATLNISKVFEEAEFKATAYGRQFPEFWVQKPLDGNSFSVGNGTHFAFIAMNEAEVQAFHAAALEAGAVDDGAPGLRPQYSDAYYGCFVRDLDGHKIEAMYWDESKM